MQRLKAALTCALLAAATGLVVQAMLCLHDATQAARALPVAVSGELQDTCAVLVAEIDLARQDATGQITALRKDVLGEVAEIRKAADRRIGDTLGRVDTAIGKVDEIRGDFQPVLTAASSTLGHTDQIVTDLRPQLLGLVAGWKVVGGETAQTMRDVRGAVPGFLKQGDKIAANVQLATLRFSSVADNVDRLTKPKWYDRLLGYTVNGFVIYRDLHPGTNVVVKSAEMLAARP